MSVNCTQKLFPQRSPNYVRNFTNSVFSCFDVIFHLLRNALDIHHLISFQYPIEIKHNEPNLKGKQTVDIRRNIRLAHSSVHTVCNNADKVKESAKNLDNITCQQSETGTVCLHNKTTTVLSG